MSCVWCSVAFILLNPVLQTSILSSSQTRPTMVQWLNPQSPTTLSCNPAVTPPSPKLSPFLSCSPATPVDKPPERYMVGMGVESMVTAHGRGSLTRAGPRVLAGKAWCGLRWPPGQHLQPCLRAAPLFLSKDVLGRNLPPVRPAPTYSFWC